MNRTFGIYTWPDPTATDQKDFWPISEGFWPNSTTMLETRFFFDTGDTHLIEIVSWYPRLRSKYATG